MAGGSWNEPFPGLIIQTVKQELRTVSKHRKRSCNGSLRNVYVAVRLIQRHIQFITNICILSCPWQKLPSPRPIVMHLCPLVSVKMQLHCSPQVQLASAKLAICLKNSVLGVEKLSFLRGLKFSLRPTLRTKLSEKSLKLDFLGMY